MKIKKYTADFKHRTDSFMEVLAGKFQGVLDWKYFELITSLIMIINPFALTPQLYSAVTAPDVKGVNVVSLALFALIQVTFGFIAIKARKFWIWLSMVISFICSVATITVVILRT